MPGATRKELGFTLIELMAVLVIISLMTGIVVMSVPAKKDPIEIYGQSMQRSFSMAAHDSVISGLPQAFGFYSDGFVSYVYEGGEWVVESELPWPEDADISFYKDDVSIDLPPEPVPIVIFDPLGLSTEFSLELEGLERTLTFRSFGDGKVSLETEL